MKVFREMSGRKIVYGQKSKVLGRSLEQAGNNLLQAKLMRFVTSLLQQDCLQSGYNSIYYLFKIFREVRLV